MSEQSDVGATGNMPQAEAPVGPNQQGSWNASGKTPIDSSLGNRSASRRGRAAVFGKMNVLEPTVNAYVKFLVDKAFQAQTVEAVRLEDIKQRIPDSIAGSTAAVVLIVRECDTDSELSDIVGVLRDCIDEDRKLLLVYCRIAKDPDRLPATLQAKLRNSVIVSCVVGTATEASEFIGELLKLQQDSKNLLLQNVEALGKFSTRVYSDLAKDFVWDLPDRMLQADEYFAKIVGDGSHLVRLDPGILESLCKEARTNEDQLSYLVYRNHIGRRALIINNADFKKNPRANSDVDCANMRHLLTTMGYQVQEEWNLKAEKMKSAVMKFANATDDSDCCVLVVMSHGSYGSVKGVDDVDVVEADLLRYMRNGRGVTRKPRLVIFQACQIDKSASAQDLQVDVNRLEHARKVGETTYGAPLDVVEPSNRQCGLIVAHSTSPGDYAFRGPSGSRFVLALCATFYEYAHKEDVVAMVTRVNFIMTHGFRRGVGGNERQDVQLPCWTVQTDKKLFLVDTGPLEDKERRETGKDEATGQPAQVSEE